MGLFDGGAYQDAQEQLDKYYKQGQGYLDPYNRQGQQQYKNLMTYINSYMNPAQLLGDWSNAYKESDYAKNQENLAQQEGLNAANAMGLLGSNTALHALQSGTAQIGMQDKENYLNRLMDTYGRGAGLAQGIYGVGAGAAGQQSQNAIQMGENSAKNALGQAQGGMLPGIIGQAVGSIGGPIGTAIGGAIGNAWSTSGGQLPKPFGL